MEDSEIIRRGVQNDNLFIESKSEIKQLPDGGHIVQIIDLESTTIIAIFEL